MSIVCLRVVFSLMAVLSPALGQIPKPTGIQAYKLFFQQVFESEGSQGGEFN